MEFAYPTKPFPITPSDTALFERPATSIIVGTAGSVHLLTPDGTEITATLPAGVYPLSAVRVYSSGTTATGLYGLARGGYQAQRWRTVDLTQIPDWSTYGFTPADILSVERNEAGEWRAGYHLRQQLPASWRTFVKVFVDPIHGSDANNGTAMDLAKRSLSAALAVTNANDDYLVLVADGSRFQYGMGNGPWCNDDEISPGYAGRSVVIMPIGVWASDGEGEARWCSSMEISTSQFSASGQILVLDIATDTSAPDPNNSAGIASGMVFDFGDSDEFGCPRRYIGVGTLALMEDTPYSYWYDDANRRISVNTVKSASDPTLDIRVFIAKEPNGYLERDGREIYVVNGDFEGGRPFFIQTSMGALKLRMYGCRFSLSGADRQGFFLNGTATGTAEIGLYNCEAYGNAFDGFSYYGNANFAEVECRSYANGVPGSSTNANLVNGFTTHFPCKGIRVACEAFANSGPNFADSAYQGACNVLNLGCRAYDSRGNPSVNYYNVDFTVNSSTTATQNPRMWLLDPKWETVEGTASRSRIALRIDADNVGADPSKRPRLYVNDELPNRMGYNGGATVTDVIRIAPPLS